MWEITWFEGNEKKSLKVNNSLIDVETELIGLEELGVNTNNIEVIDPQGNKHNYLDAMYQINQSLNPHLFKK